MGMAQSHLLARLENLGFAQGKQIKLYGQRFEIIREPLVLTDDVAFIKVMDGKSGQSRYVRLPLLTLKIASVSRVVWRSPSVLTGQT